MALIIYVQAVKRRGVITPVLCYKRLKRNHKDLNCHPAAIQPIPTSAYPLPAPRPTNSRLDCGKLTQCFGLSLPHWQQGVAEVVAQL
jgi:dTDP-4-dehydrorhamnose reductase